MIEASHWHPVALSCDLAAAPDAPPIAAILLEQALVLWRDGTGQIHAWADQCPHRGAKLSLGRIVGGRLECGYHGWQFDAAGQCLHVPALPAFSPPASHCARVYEACEAYGLVWVRLATAVGAAPSLTPPSTLPALPGFAAEADDALRKLNCGPYDVATSAPRVIENFLDMAHFAFVHEGWLGASGFSAIDDYQVTPTATGLIATGCKAWQPKSNVHSTAPAQVEYNYEVTAPYAAVLTKVPEAASVTVPGYRESIALFICPVSPEHSRVWFRLAVADFASPDDKLRAFQHTIFMQDQPVLESQTPKRLPLEASGTKAERHTAADKASAAYRRHLKQLGLTFGVC